MARLSGFYFAYFLAMGAFSPYFPPWLQTQGLDAGQISLLLGIWYGTRIFAPSAWLEGIRRTRRPAAWLVGGCVCTLLTYSLLLLPLPWLALAAVVLVFSTSYNAVLPQFEAITLHALAGRRERYALIRLWGSIGFLVANLSYGALLDVWGTDQLVALILPAFALLAASAWWAAPHAAGSAPTRQRTPLDPATRHAMRQLLWIALLMQVCHAPFYVYLSLFLAEAGWSATAIGGWWAMGVLAEVAVFTQMPRVLRRWPATRLLGVCLGAGAVRWCALALWPESALAVGLTQLLHAATFAMFHASLMQALVARTPAEQLHAAQARLYAMGTGVGGLAGALLAGACWTWIGHAESFFAAGLLSLLAISLLRGLHRPLAVQPLPD